MVGSVAGAAGLPLPIQDDVDVVIGADTHDDANSTAERTGNDPNVVVAFHAGTGGMRSR